TELLVARIFAFRRKRQKEVAWNVITCRTGCNRTTHPVGFQDRENQFLRCARIGRRFENHELPFLQMRRDGFRCLFNVRQIRFAAFVERSGNANQNGVRFFELCKIGGRGKMPGIYVLLNLSLGNVLYVGPARIQHAYFGRISIEPRNLVACFRKSQCKRQTDISATDDANLQLRTLKKLRLPIDWHKFVHAPSGELLQAGTTRLIQNKKITCEAPKRLADSLRYAKISIESASLTYMTIVVLIIGFCAGSLVGLLGIGGGVVLVPAMVHLLHMDQHAAQGTSLFVLLPPIGLGAFLEYRKKGNVDLRAGILCAVGMLFGGYIGGKIAVPMPTIRLTQL